MSSLIGLKAPYWWCDVSGTNSYHNNRCGNLELNFLDIYAKKMALRALTHILFKV